MKRIELHGILATKFGKYFELSVSSAREACHAIAVQIPEFKKFMLQSEQKGIRYAVFLDDTTPEKNIGESQLDDITSAETIHIMPKMMGAGGDAFGILQVVAGIAMVGVGVFTFGATSAIGMGLIGAGIGLTLGGAASLLMPNPKVEPNDPDGNTADNYGFGGAVTTIAQGNPVSVLYGQRMVGGAVGSAAIYTEDKQ